MDSTVYLNNYFCNDLSSSLFLSVSAYVKLKKLKVFFVSDNLRYLCFLLIFPYCF